MPGGIGFLTPNPSYFGGNITISVNNGTLSEDRLDDMCRRIMTPYFYLNQQQSAGYPPIDGSEVGLNYQPGMYEWAFVKHLLAILECPS